MVLQTDGLQEEHALELPSPPPGSSLSTELQEQLYFEIQVGEDGNGTQWVEHLPSMHNTLDSSIP